MTRSEPFWIHLDCHVDISASGDYEVPMPATTRGPGPDTFLLDAASLLTFHSAKSACQISYKLFSSKTTSSPYSGTFLSLTGSILYLDTDQLTSESVYLQLELPNGKLITSNDF